MAFEILCCVEMNIFITSGSTWRVVRSRLVVNISKLSAYDVITRLLRETLSDFSLEFFVFGKCFLSILFGAFCWNDSKKLLL